MIGISDDRRAGDVQSVEDGSYIRLGVPTWRVFVAFW